VTWGIVVWLVGGFASVALTLAIGPDLMRRQILWRDKKRRKLAFFSGGLAFVTVGLLVEFGFGLRGYSVPGLVLGGAMFWTAMKPSRND
jgi:hypothetical protein